MVKKFNSKVAATVKDYLHNKPEALEGYPFGPDAAVFKVRDKVFAILSVYQGCDAINLKCEPMQASALRDIFPAVIPGYHMNKKHWNTVILDGSIPSSELQRMIDHSYERVVKGMKKADRIAMIALYRNHLENIASL